MVVLVPITFLVPAALVFLPPLMPLMPAVLPRSVQFTTLVIGLSAVASVFPHRFVEFVFCMSDSALTFVEISCLNSWRCGAKQNPCHDA